MKSLFLVVVNKQLKYKDNHLIDQYIKNFDLFY